MFYSYLIGRSDIAAIQQLDKNQYSDNELREVKLPLHLPYINDMSDFERCDGTIEYNGIHYNYVKRKVHNDTLYILCKPNFVKTRLTGEKSDYAAKVNDIPVNKKGSVPTAKKGIYASEYNQLGEEYDLTALILSVWNTWQMTSSDLISSFCPTPAEPPDHC